MRGVVRRALARSASREQFPISEEQPDSDRDTARTRDAVSDTGRSRETPQNSLPERAFKHGTGLCCKVRKRWKGWCSLSPGTKEGEVLSNSYLVSGTEHSAAADCGVPTSVNDTTPEGV